MTITVVRTVSMGHRLPSYNGLCQSAHGHNMRVEVEVEDLRIGKFLDFKVVDKFLAGLTDQFDHAMILHGEDPLAKVLNDMKFRTYITTEEPTTEVIARLVFNHMQSAHAWKVRHVTIYETDKYSATCVGA